MQRPQKKFIDTIRVQSGTVKWSNDWWARFTNSPLMHWLFMLNI